MNLANKGNLTTNVIWALVAFCIVGMFAVFPVSAVGEETTGVTQLNANVNDLISIQTPTEQAWSLLRGINIKTLGDITVNSSNAYSVSASATNNGKFNLSTTLFGESIQIKNRYGYFDYINETSAPVILVGTATPSESKTIVVKQNVFTSDPSSGSIRITFKAGVL